MAVCAPLRRAHSPPVPGTGKPCSLSFHLQKSVLQGAWRHSPAYLCARPLAGRAGTPKGQRISGKIGGSAAGNAHRTHTMRALRAHATTRGYAPHADTPDARPMRTVTRPIRTATHASSHTHTRTRGRQRPRGKRGMSRGFPRDFGADRGHRAQHVPCALPHGGARFFA